MAAYDDEMQSVLWWLAELERRFIGSILHAEVVEVDYSDRAKPRMKLKYNWPEDEARTGWMPITAPGAKMGGGNINSWVGFNVGDQMMICAPGGDLENSILITSIHSKKNPAPNDKAGEMDNVIGKLHRNSKDGTFTWQLSKEPAGSSRALGDGVVEELSNWMLARVLRTGLGISKAQIGNAEVARHLTTFDMAKGWSNIVKADGDQHFILNHPKLGILAKVHGNGIEILCGGASNMLGGQLSNLLPPGLMNQLISQLLSLAGLGQLGGILGNLQQFGQLLNGQLGQLLNLDQLGQLAQELQGLLGNGQLSQALKTCINIVHSKDIHIDAPMTHHHAKLHLMKGLVVLEMAGESSAQALVGDGPALPATPSSDAVYDPADPSSASVAEATVEMSRLAPLDGELTTFEGGVSDAFFEGYDVPEPEQYADWQDEELEDYDTNDEQDLLLFVLGKAVYDHAIIGHLHVAHGIDFPEHSIRDHIGELGGDLAGLIDNPRIRSIDRQVAKDAIGELGGHVRGSIDDLRVVSVPKPVACDAVGDLGGDLSGALPNPTIKHVAATAITDWHLLPNAADDAAAATAGVAVGHLYRNGSIVMVRVA